MIAPDEHVALLAERLEEMGVEGVAIRGSEVWARCPFHDERTPSFSVNPAAGAHCFACGKGAPSANALLQYLANKKGIAYNPLTDDEEFIFAFVLADNNPLEAIPYRTLDPAVLEIYDRDPEHFVKGWGIAEEVVIRRNLVLDPVTGHECFPIRDRAGRLWGMVERTNSFPKYLYPPGLRKAEHLIGEDAFFTERIRRGDSVWVVEGIRDLCAVESKIEDAIAVAVGGAVPSREQLQKIRSYGRVVLAMDNDEAGMRGTELLIQSLPHDNLYVAEFDGKDPHEAKHFDLYPAWTAAF